MAVTSTSILVWRPEDGRPSALEATGNTGKMDIVATVTGGGVSGQAGALRHGVARALLLASEDNRAS